MTVSAHVAATTSPSRAECIALMDERGALEARIAAVTAQLSAMPCGVSGPLVDKEGFPRADCDVHAARTARHQLAVHMYDHKALTARIETAMHALLGGGGSGGAAAAASAPAPRRPSPAAVPAPNITPFAEVGAVAPGGPAEADDLRVGDLVVQFGHLQRGSGDSRASEVAAAAALVVSSQGRPLTVVLLRDGERKVISVTPRPWAGAGLLAVRLLPCDA